MRDGDTRWINRGGYDLGDLDPEAALSAEGIPKARSLYGSLVEQLREPGSFACQVKRILAVRRSYGVASARQLMVPVTEHPSLLVMVHELPAGRGIQVTALNFGPEPLSEVLHFPDIEPGPVVDIITERLEGDLSPEGDFRIELEGYEALALRVVSNVPIS